MSLLRWYSSLTISLLNSVGTGLLLSFLLSPPTPTPSLSLSFSFFQFTWYPIWLFLIQSPRWGEVVGNRWGTKEKRKKPAPQYSFYIFWRIRMSARMLYWSRSIGGRRNKLAFIFFTLLLLSLLRDVHLAYSPLFVVINYGTGII